MPHTREGQARGRLRSFRPQLSLSQNPGFLLRPPVFSRMVVPTIAVETSELSSADCFPFPRNPHLSPQASMPDLLSPGTLLATWKLYPAATVVVHLTPWASVPPPLLPGNKPKLLDNPAYVLVNFPHSLSHSLRGE